MAWTAPMTAVANSVFSAAQFNLHVRDNLNETAPAKATAAGRFLVTSGANSVTERVITEANVDTSQTTTSTSATDLTTVGPSVTVTTGTSALVLWSCEMTNNTSGQVSLTDFVVTGASSRAASDATALKLMPSAAGSYPNRSGVHTLLTGLTPGANTFTLKYWVGGGTGSFAYRRITVLGL
ncbi:hypothetical protein [Saccharothrix texasensis]|uniref:Uncharacterized protein n=1 Tax=Saccharothrix texasensis TaxID=103734 RepID=A0A3N1H178_9PSEU|nr:hypothetical protein [Saccharothrix texasensis]ROP36293.1 hypothetical protein EDD40_1558 [Saccharothrix texasensis]